MLQDTKEWVGPGGVRTVNFDEMFTFKTPTGAEKPDPKPIGDGQDPFHWLQDMRNKDPDEILTALVEGDPLQIADSCWRVLREMGYMLSEERLLEAGLEEIAFRTSRAEFGQIQLDWIDHCLRLAIERLVERDAMDVMDTLYLEEDPRFPLFIVEHLNVRDIYAKQASIEFNSLPRETRIAFYEVFCDLRPVKEYLDEHGISEDVLKRRIEDALESLGNFDSDGIPSTPKSQKPDAEDKS
jgi:hypothetical protein